eukprot:COSAG03_NODE_27959_length_241_cov_2.132353_1_plen_36_part_10
MVRIIIAYNIIIRMCFTAPPRYSPEAAEYLATWLDG